MTKPKTKRDPHDLRLCEHANESPQSCPCSPQCNCKLGMCRITRARKLKADTQNPKNLLNHRNLLNRGKLKPSPKPKPPAVGSRWRILAWNRRSGTPVAVQSADYLTSGKADADSHAEPSVFDELVIDDWLHLEQMGDCHWWMQVGDARIGVEIGRDRKATVYVFRGEYGERRGRTEP